VGCGLGAGWGWLGVVLGGRGAFWGAVGGGGGVCGGGGRGGVLGGGVGGGLGGCCDGSFFRAFRKTPVFLICILHPSGLRTPGGILLS